MSINLMEGVDPESVDSGVANIQIAIEEMLKAVDAVASVRDLAERTEDVHERMRYRTATLALLSVIALNVSMLFEAKDKQWCFYKLAALIHKEDSDSLDQIRALLKAMRGGPVGEVIRYRHTFVAHIPKRRTFAFDSKMLTLATRHCVLLFDGLLGQTIAYEDDGVDLRTSVNEWLPLMPVDVGLLAELVEFEILQNSASSGEGSTEEASR